MPALPTLMTHLQREYRKFYSHLDRLAKPKYDGVDGFVAFCEKYLSEINPAIESFFPPFSVGLRLSNNVKVVMAGGPSQQSGQMQDHTSIGISSGDTDGSDGSVPI